MITIFLKTEFGPKRKFNVRDFNVTLKGLVRCFKTCVKTKTLLGNTALKFLFLYEDVHRLSLKHFSKAFS